MIELHRVSKTYSVGPVEGPRAFRRLVPGRQGRVRGAQRGVRRGQDDAAAPPLPRRPAHRGRGGGARAGRRRGPPLPRGGAPRGARARAIVRKPPLLLADEPTGNLDDAMAAEILDVLRDIWTGGTTVVLATHPAGRR